ncbi:hypothetical protein E2C01_097082 [Portunus trituberculatus]|uniref:Uncharacterized protein n=1 Tax=Portunus trituberculatus TaxID=210409 RepID=A0A5B7K8L2_PORTR|nr:hypothetical protein [Portunus trituberculatus]
MMVDTEGEGSLWCVGVLGGEGGGCGGAVEEDVLPPPHSLVSALPLLKQVLGRCFVQCPATLRASVGADGVSVFHLKHRNFGSGVHVSQ